VSEKDGNRVIANVYGRAPDGTVRPLLVGASGGLAGSPLIDTAWATVAGVVALTPLVAWRAFADNSGVVMFSLRVEADSADGATFIVEASDDGVLAAKSHTVQIALAVGEHDVWITASPLIIRYLRLSVQPAVAGPAKVSYQVQRIPR
jgi:hypothetical protein